VADEMDVRKVVEFLRKSDLIDLEMPLSKLVSAAGDLETSEAANVFLWSQWVLITHCGPASTITAIGSAREEEGGPSRSPLGIGDPPLEEGTPPASSR
jgi:hypothetical protein